MIYDSLLLPCGGVINPAARAPQLSQNAALCVGIGGAGIASLCDLRGKLREHLRPDNPGDPVPRYEGIQLLGIDSNETEYLQFRGNQRLTEEEFFSIKCRDIPNPHNPVGAGGIRQAGQFLLMDRAPALYNKIRGKIAQALRYKGGNTVDVFLFAGLSGGTGSGCFLDVCRLIQHLELHNGWQINIAGYFFLPDVITCKPEVAADPGKVAYCNANGYAALKELDYQMRFDDNLDRYIQDYGAGLQVRTNLPPVHLCHLLSGRNRNGAMLPDGFSNALQLAADSALEYLTQGDLESRIAHITQGVLNLPRRWGGGPVYHILGGSSARISATQISTYLAAGFFRKFDRHTRVSREDVTGKAVARILDRTGLRADRIFGEIAAGCRGLNLSEIHYRELAHQPVLARGQLPALWAHESNAWLAECGARMHENAVTLTQAPEEYDRNPDPRSLADRLFNELRIVSTEPEYGPWYAFFLLEGVIDALSCETDKAMEMADCLAFQTGRMLDDAVQCNEALVNHHLFQGRRLCERYRDCVTGCCQMQMNTERCRKTAQILRTLREQAIDLHKNFFRPLLQTLDNLRETFEENICFLQTPWADQPNAYTHSILPVNHLRPRLDAAVDGLDDRQTVADFMEHLLNNYRMWLRGDSLEISRLISEYMLHIFDGETGRTMTDYLKDVFPASAGSPFQLAGDIEQNLLRRIDADAVPVFWCDPIFDIRNPQRTFVSGTLSVPGGNVIGMAAGNFAANTNCTIRYNGAGDRFLNLRTVSGVPLFACDAIFQYKRDYEAAAHTAGGDGMHLRANTARFGRNADLRTYLPSPIPWSFAGEQGNPEQIPWVEAYHEAVALEIIVPRPNWYQFATNDYLVLLTPEPEVREYAPEDFRSGEIFDRAALEEELDRIRQQLDSIHGGGNLSVLRLKNNGSAGFEEAVRLDHFLMSPILREAVLKEIDRRKRLLRAEGQLLAIRDEQLSFEKDLTEFADLLFYGILQCRDLSGQTDYENPASVSFSYETEEGIGDTLYLVRMDTQYPLYKAFAAFRQKDGAEARAWEALADALQQRRMAAYSREDTYIPAILEQIWDRKAVPMPENRLWQESEEFRRDFLRFRDGLRHRVRYVKDIMPWWPRGRTVRELTEALQGRLPEQKAGMVRICHDGQSYECWPELSDRYAFSREESRWVPLVPQMLVDHNGQWLPIELDGDGKIRLPDREYSGGMSL